MTTRKAISALVVLLLLAVISVPGIGSPADVVRLCPTNGGSKQAEERCLQALDDARSSGNTQLQAELLEGLAVIYQRQGRRADAIESLQRSIKLSDHPFNASMELADILESSGRIPGAIAVLESLLARFSSSSDEDKWLRGSTEMKLGDLYQRLGKPSLAEAQYLRSIQDLSEIGHGALMEDPALRLMHLYVSQGKRDTAKEVCQKWKRSTGLSKEAAEKMCVSIVAALTRKHAS